MQQFAACSHRKRKETSLKFVSKSLPQKIADAIKETKWKFGDECVTTNTHTHIHIYVRVYLKLLRFVGQCCAFGGFNLRFAHAQRNA